MSHAVAPNNRLTVLLANEQEGWHQTVRQLLEPQGVETVSARSGREALNLMESRPIHVAVLDAQMPQLGGLQVIKMLREMQRRNSAGSHPSLPVPPAILLANQLTSHLLHEALGMHVFSVLSKPVDFNVLLDTLARVLRRHYENKWPSECVTMRTTITISAGEDSITVQHENGHGNGPGNGHGNGHSNGHGNGHSNGGHGHRPLRRAQ